jgi:hypothetical protein
VQKPPAFPPSKRITAAEARALVASGEFTRYPELAHKLMFGAYSSSDGRVLLMAGGRWATLVESKRALQAWSESAEALARKGGRSWAEDFPQGERFAEEVPALIAALPSLIPVKPERLDYSVKSVAAVDTAIRKVKRDILFGPDVFPALVAYIGDVVRRGVGGQWTMRPGTDCWEPWIVDPKGRLFAPLTIGKEILEHHPRQYLRIHVESALHDGSRSWTDLIERERGERQLTATVRQYPGEAHPHALAEFVRTPLDDDKVARMRAALSSGERQTRAGALETLALLSFPASFGGVRGRPLVAQAVDARVEALEDEARQLLNDPDPYIRGLAARGLFMQDARQQLLQHPPEDHERLFKQNEIPLSAETSHVLAEMLAREQVDGLRSHLLRGLIEGATPASARLDLILATLEDERAENRRTAQNGIVKLDGQNGLLGSLIARLQTQSEQVKLSAVAAIKVLRRRAPLRRALEAWAAGEQQLAVRDALMDLLTPSAKRRRQP